MLLASLSSGKLPPVIDKEVARCQKGGEAWPWSLLLTNVENEEKQMNVWRSRVERSAHR